MNKQETLSRYFGFSSFRDGQEALIDALLSGRDAFGVMPTGAGKSLCFQVPAIMLPGITLVISPLISLMKDQVAALLQSGVPCAYINSSLSPSQTTEALRRAAQGMYKIIYVAPERLITPAFLRFAVRADLSLVAVDEAHCISQWGQDFRPGYRKIDEFLRKLPVRPPVGAFTATATAAVRQDVESLLRLSSPLVIITGFDRPNLRFIVREPDSKSDALIRFIGQRKDLYGIVYCGTRKSVEEVELLLTRNGVSATRYHAGLDAAERLANQDDFMYGRRHVMVATNAFGMGIDKSDVRYVVHYNMPKNLESYYQEAGRAGRDGESADCLLLYGRQDVVLAKWLIAHTEENPDLTDEERSVIRDRDMNRLQEITRYAAGKQCLRAFILRYFGQNAPCSCGNCSVCIPFGKVDRRFEPHRSLSRKAAENAAAEASVLEEEALFQDLSEMRRILARNANVPAFIVFSDASLRDMAKKKPRTTEEFLLVSGVGEAKMKKYAEAFLAVIRIACMREK